LRLDARPFLRRLVVIIMMAAATAFFIQGFCVATSEAATGDASHYYHGFAIKHASGENGAHSHVSPHVHADGTAHQHALDDDDGALDNHAKQVGWNMAIVLGVLPASNVFTIALNESSKLSFEKPDPLRVGGQSGLRKPPRSPGMT